MRSSRLEALSDGIFAIAITLIVLEIQVPHVSSTEPDPTPQLLAALGRLLPLFGVYVLSFIMLGIYWIGHHNQMHLIHQVDRPFIWLNLMFFMCICFVPFSAGLLGSYPLEWVSIIIYAINLILNGLSLLAIWLYATGHGLTHEPVHPELMRNVIVRIMMPVVVYAAAIVVAFFAAPVSLAMLLLPPITQVLPGTVDRHLR